MTPQPSARYLLALILFAVPFVGCSQPAQLGEIEVIPDAPQLIAGQTVQFKAIGAYAQNGHPFQLRDITTQVTWSSAQTSVATVSGTGMATGVGAGSTTILATIGSVNGTASLTVTGQAAHDLTSIMVIPASQTLTSIGESSQFIAIGTYSTAPITLDLTNSVAWQSSDVKVATVNGAGLALANFAGTTTITALGVSNSGSAITGTGTLTVGNASGGVDLPELTIYTVGLGSGTVTSSDGVINCPTLGGAACTGSYTVGAAVTLTATPGAGSVFGGWSVNCTAISPTSCTIVMNNNEPVGAIFNQ